MTHYYKYPKTPHLPWSKTKTDDDSILSSVDHFKNKNVVVSIKMDGESTSCYKDHIHARSIDSRYHVSQSWIKAVHGMIKHDIPENWRICMENMYAKHSIFYDNLEAYAYVLSIWNEKNICLSYSQTLIWCNLFNLIHVPVIYHGIWDEEKIHSLYTPTRDGCQCEGYVVRIENEFHYDDFHLNVAKYVRPKHVQTSDHWKLQPVVPNLLKKQVET